MTRGQKTAVVGLLVAAVVALLLWLLRGAPADHDAAPASGRDPVADAGQEGPAAGRTTTTGAGARSSDDAGGPEPAAANAIATFRWGSADDALGRERQQEGNPEGPMSLAVGPDGSIWVLDQVNQRLVRLDANGKRLGSTPLPVQAGQDVVVTKDGTALVLDRLVDKSVAVIGPDGKPRGELPIEGKGLAEGGASTGLFHDGDDVLVEREHGDLVRIGKTSGKADPERGEVPGRPAKDGANYFTMMLVDATQGLVALTAVAKATLAHRYTRQLGFGQPIVNLVLLDTDAGGLAYVGAHVELPGSSLESPKLGVVVLCVDGRDGSLLGRTSFVGNTVADESFRELTVSGDGSILFLRRTEQAATLERYRCQ
ncbi:MAG: hypothetical protein JNJ54_19445 [Myxococcaceae bacterium]|nr:hypothetical protein [Myxococcaceae bacterium]